MFKLLALYNYFYVGFLTSETLSNLLTTGEEKMREKQMGTGSTRGQNTSISQFVNQD